MAKTTTRAARLEAISNIIEDQEISSQTDLVKLLEEMEFPVTQATLSRDLEELGAVKVRGTDGATPIYAIFAEGQRPLRETNNPSDRLIRTLKDTLIAAIPANNLAVLRVPPGAAQYLASAIDRSGLSDIIGTIAGDDTIACIAREGITGQQICDLMLTWSANPHTRTEDTPAKGATVASTVDKAASAGGTGAKTASTKTVPAKKSTKTNTKTNTKIAERNAARMARKAAKAAEEAAANTDSKTVKKNANKTGNNT